MQETGQVRNVAFNKNIYFYYYYVVFLLCCALSFMASQVFWSQVAQM